MRAVVLESYGGPEVLTIRDIPDPVAGPEEVLVEVTGTAVNRADLLQRLGLYAPPPPAPTYEVPGLEFAGRVAAVGERVVRWRVGDEVMGIVSGGGYAELLAVHERQVMSVPEALGLADAAAVPEVFLTAWDALVRQGGLTSGRWALVHAGASGVGTAAIQIAKAIGARVMVTTSTAKVDACHELGADVVVDYHSADFVDVAKEVTGGEGADVILDVVGGDYLLRNLDAVRVTGRIVQVGTLDPSPVVLPLGKILPKRITIIGTVLRARPLEEKIAVTQRFIREVLPLFESRALRPVIDTHYPLEEVAVAHERMAENANVGKLLLNVVPR